MPQRKLSVAVAWKRLKRARRGELGGLARDFFYVALWQGAGTIAELTLIALVTHSLGLAEYGRYTLVVAVVIIAGEFFGVRVGIAVTTHAASKIGRDSRAFAGIVQLGWLLEGAGATAGVLLIAALAPLFGPELVGEDAVFLLIVYSLTLFATAVERPSFAILRLLDRFRLIAGLTSLLELGRLVLVVAAIVFFDSLPALVAALAVARLGAGAVTTLVASRVFQHSPGGVSLRQPAVAAIERDERRQIYRTALHTNVIAYTKLAQFQVPTVVIGAVVGPTETAIYKLGTAVATMVGRLVDPATTALLPRLSRLWAAGRHRDLRRLIQRASLISIPAILIGLTVLIAFRDPILTALGGGQAAAEAGTVLILAAIGQTIFASSFWRATVLFAAHKARTVAAVNVLAAAVQVALLAVLVPTLGAEGAAVALLINMAISAAFLTTSAVRTLRTAVSHEDAERAAHAHPGGPEPQTTSA